MSTYLGDLPKPLHDLPRLRLPECEGKDWRWQVPLPNGGHHVHYIFSNHASLGDLLWKFMKELAETRRHLESIPKAIVPPLKTLSHPEGRIEAVLPWLYFLHWAGSQWPRPGYSTEVHFRWSSQSYGEDGGLSEWAECPTVSDFDPVDFLTLEQTDEKSFDEWAQVYLKADRLLPQAIVLSLNKKFQYASVRAIREEVLVGLLHKAQPAKQRPTRGKASTSPKPEGTRHLLRVLVIHHIPEGEPPRDERLSQEQLRQRLGEDHQGTVSKRFKNLLSFVPGYERHVPIEAYKEWCSSSSGQIFTVLDDLQRRFLDVRLSPLRRLRRPEGIADKGPRPDEIAED